MRRLKSQRYVVWGGADKIGSSSSAASSKYVESHAIKTMFYFQSRVSVLIK